MAGTPLQHRRGTHAEVIAAVQALGEIGYDTTQKRLTVGDGVTAGGSPAAKLADFGDLAPVWCGTAGGTANAITLSPATAPSALAAGLRVQFLAAADNTGNVTLNVSSLGTVSLRRMDGSEFPAGVILSGDLMEVVYTGTGWRSQPRADDDVVAMLVPSAAASVDALLPSKYAFFEFDVNVVMGTDAVGLIARTSTNSGSSYDTGAADYQTQSTYTSAAGTLTAGVGAATTFMGLTPGVDNGATSTLLGRGTVFPGDGTRFPRVNIFGGGAFDTGSGGFQGISLISAARLSATRINGIRFLPSSGTFTGRITIRGLRG